MTIDEAIHEFRLAIGDLFASHDRREIELLKSRIAERRRNHKSTVIQQRELCELMSRQLRRELAA